MNVKRVLVSNAHEAPLVAEFPVFVKDRVKIDFPRKMFEEVSTHALKTGTGQRHGLGGAGIEPLSSIGEVAIRIFGFNSPERLLERVDLIDLGRYPGRDLDF